MPNITINEISQTYAYNVGTNAFATVAIPITASWGPSLKQTDFESANLATSATSKQIMEQFEDVEWKHFPSSQEGMQKFLSVYRGPAANYKSAKDYSFQMAMTYLASGYDILVCRVSSGTEAQASHGATTSSGTNTSIVFKAIYQGSFGNSIVVNFKSVPYYKKTVSNSEVQVYYYNAIVYIKDEASGAMTAVENLMFVFEQGDESDNIPFYEDVKSNFITISVPTGTIVDTDNVIEFTVTLGKAESGVEAVKGTDAFDIPTGTGASGYADDPSKIAAVMGTIGYTPESSTKNVIFGATFCSNLRYSLSNIVAGGSAYPATPTSNSPTYVQKLYGMSIAPSAPSGDPLPKDYRPKDINIANIIRCNEFTYTAAFVALTMLMDKLNYAPQRIAVPGWDDQNFDNLNFDRTGYTGRIDIVSPLHRKVMEVSYYSRCACGMLDIPKSCPRKYVSAPDTGTNTCGYAQLVSADRLATTYSDADTELYPSHVALFAPWGKYRFVGMGKSYTAAPSFLAMLIQRAMILNQSIQYEWVLPTNRTHTLKIGEMDYKTPKHILDVWQAQSGIGVNAITEIPGQGITVWGNSTLFDVAPATYNALQNLSTRYLIDALKNVVYRCGINITFQYNNKQAYSAFYAGVTPILDTMKNVGAIDDYLVQMAPGLDAEDQIMSQSVIGFIYLTINGVITDVTVDLVALPQGTDLSQFGE